MIKNLKEILEPLGMKEEDFKAQYEATEEHEIPVKDYVIEKKADQEAKIENIKKIERTAAVEIAVKEARTKLNLDFTGKTIDNLVDAFGKKVLADAKIAPDAKVVELTGDLEKLRTANKTWEDKYTGLENTFKQKEKESTVNSTVLTSMPKVKTKIPVADMAIIFNTKYKPLLNDEGKLVFHNEKGEVLKNEKTLNPKTIDEVMLEFQDPYIEKVPGGGGGGDGTGQAKPGTIEAFNKEMEAKGIKIGTTAYNDEMKSAIAAKTLKF